MQHPPHTPLGSLRLIVACLLTAMLSPAAQAQPDTAALAGSMAATAPTVMPSSDADAVLLDMATAYRRKDAATLSALLPQARGHLLEAWAAYWELAVRLPTASAAEVDTFLARYQGTYQEDRLRNDWLLHLGRTRDFARFAQYYPDFRMRDDRQVRCYALYADAQQGRSAPDDALVLREHWYALRDADDACTLAAGALYAQGRITAADIWHKARLSAQANRMSAARNAAAVLDATAAASMLALFANPAAYLDAASAPPAETSASARELAVLALTRIAAKDPASAAYALHSGWTQRLGAEHASWAWGEVGRQAALNLDTRALGYFQQAAHVQHMGSEQLGWYARAALRMGQWPHVLRAILAMPQGERLQPVWTYWHARALLATQAQNAAHEASALYQRIAGNQGFYEQLALEALGQHITIPRAPTPITTAEQHAAASHPSLRRALYARQLGLMGEATREWNYATNLHQYGGMNDRDLLAAADLACRQQWWDRCINTSERTRGVVHMAQRFPTPYRNTVLAYSQQAGLDPAYVYGLIRQESRFVPRARSGVGAAGLMQVMPGTARLVARKLGISYQPASINDLDTNTLLGTAYLKMALDSFGGSYPLAAAAYNAGPNRPRAWRNGPVLEGAIWAENIPFSETRDYVKKVLANTTNYSLLFTGQPQSLHQRLGHVAPLEAGLAEEEP